MYLICPLQFFLEMLREKLKLLTIHYKLQSYLKKDTSSYHANTVRASITVCQQFYCNSLPFLRPRTWCKIASVSELGAHHFKEKHLRAHIKERNLFIFVYLHTL